MTKEPLLTEIEEAARALNIAPSTLCKRAVDNTRLPERLREGSTVTLVTAARVREYIAANVPAEAGQQ